MNSKIPFLVLEKVLLEQGLQRSTKIAEHRVYYHAPTDTIIALPLYDDTSPVREVHLASTRTLLEGRGVLAEGELDRLLQGKQSAMLTEFWPPERSERLNQSMRTKNQPFILNNQKII
jgi:hypothetical protein